MRNDLENGMVIGADAEWERQNRVTPKEPVRTFTWIGGKFAIREVEEDADQR